MTTKYTVNMKEEWGLTLNQFEAIKLTMNLNASQYLDSQTGEINCTGLAEYTAFNLNHPEWLDDETHPLWDLAVDIAQRREKMIVNYPLNEDF